MSTAPQPEQTKRLETEAEKHAAGFHEMYGALRVIAKAETPTVARIIALCALYAVKIMSTEGRTPSDEEVAAWLEENTPKILAETSGDAPREPSASLLVNGIVSHRDQQPYVQLSNEHGIYAQLSSAMAQKVALDILRMISRTEADAMLFKFFQQNDLPEAAAGAMMVQFRDYRSQLDAEKVEGFESDPETGGSR